MKRFKVWMWVMAGVLASACTQQQDFRQAAGLRGTYDVALVGELLFVTSTDRDELRVLALDPDATKRQFVRAPNPLEPLAIPVLPRPQALARDVRYVGGEDQPGPYVYARSNGSPSISIVAAGRDALREARRLDTRQLTATQADPDNRSIGPVTAFAALAPDPGVEGAPSTLYYTTQEIAGPRLWRVRLPASPDTLRDAPALVVERLALPPELSANFAVSSLLVLPPTATASEVLALSTRQDVVKGTPGKSYRVELTGTGGTFQVLQFGGAQVLQLATHARVPAAEEGQPDLMPAGKRIFGVLDTSNCREVPRCSLGVVAVDSTTGTVEKDVTGYDMRPINFGIGLPTGLSVSTNTGLLRQGGETREFRVPLLGIMPLSNGTILFFDAFKLQQLNVGAWLAGQENTATASATLVSVTGTDITLEGLTYGVTRDDAFLLTQQGVLPGMSALDRDVSTTIFEVPFKKEVPTLVPRVGDAIVLLPAGAGQQACGTDVRVAAVEPGSTDTLRRLVPEGELPEACASFSRFQVRAGGSQPLVLTTSAGGYLERLGRGDTYSRENDYFFNPPGYAGQARGSELFLRYLRDPENPATRPNRGDQYVIRTDAHYIPYVIGVDLVNVDDLRAFRLPGAVVHARVGGAQGTDYAYIVYPSANGVLQVDLTRITAGVSNSVGLFPFL